MSKAAYWPPSSRHFLNFSSLAIKQVCALKTFRKPVWYFKKILLKYSDICLYWMFSKTLDKFGRILIGRQFIFLLLEFFLYAGVMSANFRLFRKFDRSIEVLTEWKRKAASRSKFCLIILVGKSDLWIDLPVFRFCNSFLISLYRRAFKWKFI